MLKILETAPTPGAAIDTVSSTPWWVLAISIVGAVAAISSAVAAWAAVRIASKNLVTAVEAQVAATRPVIDAQLRPLPLVHGTVELVVSNAGKTVARDVTVTFDPALPPFEGRQNGQLAPFISRRYARAIPTLGPGAELVNVYAHVDEETNREGVPNDLIVTARYHDGHGHTYEDRYELSIDSLRDQTTSSRSIPQEADQRRLLAQSVESLAKRWGR